MAALCATDAKCIADAKKMVEDKELYVNLLVIRKNFKIVAETILQLEERGMSLIDSTKLVQDLRTSLNNVSGEIANAVKE